MELTNAVALDWPASGQSSTSAMEVRHVCIVGSSELTKALGLRQCELPTYIYRMRMLGYPPGHLEAAKIQTSGLSLFDRDGKGIQYFASLVMLVV